MAGIRDLIDGNRPIEGEVSDIQQIVAENPPVESAKNEIEERITALQPGDDIESHPLYEPNPFAEKPIETWKRLRNGEITDPDERRLAEEVVRRLKDREDGHLAHRAPAPSESASHIDLFAGLTMPED